MIDLNHIITILSFAETLSGEKTVETGCGMVLSEKVLFAEGHKTHHLNAERFLLQENRCGECSAYATLYVLASLP